MQQVKGKTESVLNRSNNGFQLPCNPLQMENNYMWRTQPIALSSLQLQSFNETANENGRFLLIFAQKSQHQQLEFHAVD